MADGGRTVLVLSAMPIELRPFVRKLQLRRSEAGGVSVRTGVAGTTPVVASVVGVGPTEARRVTGRLLDAVPAGRVIMIGVAGGVDPAFGVRSVLSPTTVIEQSTGEVLHPDYAPGVDAVGTLLTCATISTEVKLDRLRAEGVTAVDMETAAVGSVCHERGIPWTVFRSISDTLEDGLVDETTLALTRPDGSTDLAQVAKMVVRHPASVRTLIKLGQDTKAAVAAHTASALRDLGV